MDGIPAECRTFGCELADLVGVLIGLFLEDS